MPSVTERCAVCHSRKPKRICPVKGEICGPCCGREREESIDCPMDCEFLIEARMHEKSNPSDPAMLREFGIKQEFIESNQPLFTAVAIALLNGVLENEGVNDNDIRDCLDAAVRNRKTRESGLVYEAKPDNRLAASILEHFERRLADFRKESANWPGFPRIKDSDEQKMVAFLKVLEAAHNNGRRRSRSFVHFLYGVAAQNLPPAEAETAVS